MNLIYTEQRNALREIQNIANQLLASNEIRWWNNGLKAWNEPSFVVTAHETATKCAIEFKEQLDLSIPTYQSLMRNPDDFMWLFAVSFLRHLGFRPYIAWTYLRSPIADEIDNIATVCAQSAHNMFRYRRTNPDFIERFIHAFFNCTISSEQKLLNNLGVSQVFRKIADSWKRIR